MVILFGAGAMAWIFGWLFGSLPTFTVSQVLHPLMAARLCKYMSSMKIRI